MFFLGVKRNFYGVKNARFFPIFSREKSHKTLKKYAWKKVFAREIFRKIKHVKANFTRVKNIDKLHPSKGKSAREKYKHKFML